MPNEKNSYSAIMGKMVVTKEGKRIGFVRDITFESRSGELISLVLREVTPYARNLNLEKTKNDEMLVPYNSIIAVGDFVVISEEDII
jgi:sporulation protein YlmC with PRC-barrel domain